MRAAGSAGATLLLQPGHWRPTAQTPHAAPPLPLLPHHPLPTATPRLPHARPAGTRT